MKEMDLFAPIKNYFEQSGFDVDGEVNDCDMLCIDKNQTIAVELKNELNFKLFIQGAKRQKLFDIVYIAVWMPKNIRTKVFKDKVYLLNRLGLGLILVSKRTKKVEIYQEPTIHEVINYQRKNKKRRDKMVSEMKKRRLRTNTGGVKGKPIVTAYRESALIILDVLSVTGAMKAAKIKEVTKIDNSYNIVYHNHYNWFVKEGNGIYSVSEEGKKAKETHEALIRELRTMETDD